MRSNDRPDLVGDLNTGAIGGVTRLRKVKEAGKTALTALFLRRHLGQEKALRRQFDRKTALFTMRIRLLTNTYSYTSRGFLQIEDGPWASDALTNTYSNHLNTGFALQQPFASAWTQAYGYDPGNRLSTVASGAGTFTYTYKVGNLITNIALPNGAAITNAYDSVGRLTGTYLKKSTGTILNSHAYLYDLAGERIRQTFILGNFVTNVYDNLGQVKAAIGKESGGTLRLNEQFGYAYDPAGNLNFRTNNDLTVTFNVNSLNELSSVTRNAAMTVAGVTSSGATSVTVNGTNAALYADKTYARTNYTLANGLNLFTAVATDGAGLKDTNTTIINLPTPVNFAYDLNGNMTSDGRRGFDYDEENELIRVTVTNSLKSEFTYDGRMRRRISKDYTWSGSWVLSKELHYVYDGNLVIQERDGSNNPLVTYTRGLDLSGRFQGAGGIGGLLARTDANSAFYHADGNGNVAALIDGNQNIVAKYLYDAFGNIAAATGPLAAVNTYRFSSKDYHANSGLYYHCYRFYEPNLQRWLNRDPIQEAGGFNLYGFVRNNPVGYFDHFGLQTTKPRIGEPGYVTPFPPDWRPGGLWKDDGRSTIVCDGKGGIRIQYSKEYDPAKADPCVAECHDKHELCHKQEALASNPNICVGQPDGTQITASDGVINRSEVRCSQVELNCLNERKGDCSCSDSAINSRIPKVEAYRDKYKKLLGN